MSRSLSLIMLAFLTILVVNMQASPDVGQEILEKKLESGCTISIADLSAKHTQKEWKQLKDSNKLKEELGKLSSNLKMIEDNELLDIFDFLYEYSSDSGLFPSCGN